METQNKLNLIADRYADALVELAQSGDISLETIQSDLIKLDEILAQSPDLMEFLNTPSVSAEDKKEVLQRVLKDEIDQCIIRFLKVLVDKNRFNTLDNVKTEFKKRIDKINNVSRISVVAAIELSDEVKSRLKSKLEEKLNKIVEINYEFDPQIIAGLVIKMGDNIIDTSLKQKLEDFRKNIVRI